MDEHKLKLFLIEQFEIRGNDYCEEIESIEIDAEHVEVISSIPFTYKFDETFLEMDAQSRKEHLKEKIIASGILDMLRYNFVSGFYCDFFTDIDHHHYLNDLDIIYNESEEKAYADICLLYVMNRYILEMLYNDEKFCA